MYNSNRTGSVVDSIRRQGAEKVRQDVRSGAIHTVIVDSKKSTRKLSREKLTKIIKGVDGRLIVAED